MNNGLWILWSPVCMGYVIGWDRAILRVITGKVDAFATYEAIKEKITCDT